MGANPNITSSEGVSPLMLAAGSGSLQDVALLIRRGANVNALCSQDGTPLTYAANVTVADYLERHGASARIGDITYCVSWISDAQLVEWWQRRLPTANIRTSGGVTPLMYAADAVQPECVEVLLRYGADPSLRDNRGRRVDDRVRRELSRLPKGPIFFQRRQKIESILAALARKRSVRQTAATKAPKSARGHGNRN
jgi:ankyrin repeat protein